MRGTISAAVAVLLVGSLTTGAEAAPKKFPSQTVSLIVTSSPGGVADALARMLATQLSDAWGQQVIVENRPGANTQVAAYHVAKSSADGHTLLLGPDVTFTVNPHLYKNLTYDPVRDFEPIVGLTVLRQALVLHPSVPADSVKELIALAKSKPSGLNYGTFGLGSAGHLNMEAFQAQAGVEMTAIHYKGATPALTDVLAGHTDLMFISFGSAVKHWKAGKLKMLAIGSDRRLPDFPELPTVAESGLPGFEAKSWFGLFAPGGTPKEIVNQINRDVARIFSDEEVRRKFLDTRFMEPITDSPEAYATLIRDDSQRWGNVIRDAKIKVE